MTICEKELCCGCMMCADVCPFKAITSAEDGEGFVRPVINEELCRSCGACVKKCPVNSHSENKAKKAWAAYNKDSASRENSSSGGVFALLAKDVLSRGGAVFGAGYDKDFNVVHKAITDEEELAGLMGSKYVQSNTAGLWHQVKESLESGKEVLFSGTPCQNAALTSYLGRDYENLLKVDFICHGVPTPKIWRKYLSENFGNVQSVSFRNKDHGWNLFSMKIRHENGTYSETTNNDPYFRLFLTNKILRESCHDCPFKKDAYSSDITLGDFWGIVRIFPELFDDKGISAVIARSEKGKSAIEGISDKLVMRECSVENIVSGNKTLDVSIPSPPDRERVMKNIRQDVSFAGISSEFAHPVPASRALKIKLKLKAMKVYGKIKALKNGRV